MKFARAQAVPRPALRRLDDGDAWCRQQCRAKTQVRLSVTVALAFCTQHRLIGSGLALSCYWHMVGTVAAIVLTTLSLRSLAAVRLYSPDASLCSRSKV